MGSATSTRRWCFTWAEPPPDCERGHPAFPRNSSQRRCGVDPGRPREGAAPAFEDGPSEPAGIPREIADDGDPRWAVVPCAARTEPRRQANSLASGPCPERMPIVVRVRPLNEHGTRRHSPVSPHSRP